MKNAHLILFSLICAPFFALRAQPLITDAPENEHVRLSWLYDHDGGEGGDELGGFEIGYGSTIYPMDQMIASYAHMSTDGYQFDYFMLSIEQHFALSEMIVPYGVFGFGFGWIDLKDDGGAGDQQGLLGKIGGGIMVNICDYASVFLEASYFLSNKDLWQDQDEMDAQNFLAQLGVRFHF